jgi:hypothetical protein
MRGKPLTIPKRQPCCAVKGYSGLAGSSSTPNSDQPRVHARDELELLFVQQSRYVWEVLVWPAIYSGTAQSPALPICLSVMKRPLFKALHQLWLVALFSLPISRFLLYEDALWSGDSV